MKDVGAHIGQYRVISQQTQTETANYQLYRVESTLEADNVFMLKTWPDVNISTQISVDTFTRQAQALVELQAPCVLPIKGYGIDDDSHPYLLLPDEAWTLETLAQRMERADTDPISVEEATTILREVGTALVAAHQKGIVHGYLSPASILLTSEGSVLIADFIPSLLRSIHQHFTTTSAYQPPEIRASRLSDQYALAVLAHQLRPQLTISEAAAIERAQSNDPPRRFASVRAFLLELSIDIALAEHPAEQETQPASSPHAKHISLPTIPWSRIARSKRTRWGILVALLLLMLLGVPPLYAALPAAAATVTIVPMTRSLEQTFQASIATQTNLTQQQVQGRELQYTTSTQSQSEPTSQGVIDATQAHGQLVFSQINKEIDLFSAAPLRINLSNGLTVVTDDQAKMLPGSTYTINAHVQEAGSQGNLPADAVDGFYSVGFVHPIGAPPDFFVSNPRPFTEGADVYEGPVVSNDAVDQATSALEAQLEQQAQQAFQSQLQTGEALLNNRTCASVNRQVQPGVGQASSTVTVTEAMSCTVTAYDSKSAYEVALSGMEQFAARQLGSSFALVNRLSIIATVSAASPDATSPSFQIDTQGLWQLRLDASSRQLLAQTIAGKSQAEARTLLLARFAARTTSISLTWWWGQHLPGDPQAIQIVDHSSKGSFSLPTSVGESKSA